MLIGFLIFTGGIVGLSTIQPDDSTKAIVFAGLAGVGFGAPLVLVITGVHLSTPHRLIATATGVTTSARAVAATVSTAIYAAVLTNRLNENIGNYVTEAALAAGLPSSSIEKFVAAFVAGNPLLGVAGVTPAVIAAASHALSQAFADSIRVVYIIAAPFGVLACIACLFLGNLRNTMTYRVDAPVEDLHAKAHSRQHAQSV